MCKGFEQVKPWVSKKEEKIYKYNLFISTTRCAKDIKIYAEICLNKTIDC